jgi:hypothetical protein
LVYYWYWYWYWYIIGIGILLLLVLVYYWYWYIIGIGILLVLKIYIVFKYLYYILFKYILPVQAGSGSWPVPVHGRLRFTEGSSLKAGTSRCGSDGSIRKRFGSWVPVRFQCTLK